MEEMGERRMTAILTEAAKEHDVPARELPSMARAVWSIIDGFTFYELALGAKDPEHYRGEAMKALNRLFYGWGKTPGARR